MDRPLTHEVSPAQQARLRTLFSGRGHALQRNPKNEYIAFEVRTPERSIFTLYTSGKFVCTARSGDAEGAALLAAIDELLDGAASASRGAAKRTATRATQPDAPSGVSGDAPAGEPAGASAVTAPRAPRGNGLSRGTRRGLSWLAGMDETGTGELLGSAVLGGALLPAALADAAEAVAGHVDTKSSRAASGWAALGEQLTGLRDAGLQLCTLPLPNRLFDAWSKNGLLDLAYIRLFGDLLAGAGLQASDSLADLELVIDDYGTGPLLADAVEAWRGRGAQVVVQTRADDRHLAPRLASVIAKSHRSREMTGLDAWVTDGPVGTGNAGNGVTLRWLRRRAAARGHVAGRWPPFVKASFKTVRLLDGLPEAAKRRVPPLRALLDEEAVADFLRGRLDVARAQWRDADGGRVRTLSVTATGALRAPAPPCLAWELLPALCGGLVLHSSVCAPEVLEGLLAPEAGLLSGWRVLVGPRDAAGAEDAGTLAALARAHASGTLLVVPTETAEPLARARRHAAVLLTAAAPPAQWALQLVD